MKGNKGRERTWRKGSVLLKLNKFLLTPTCYLQAKILILSIVEHFSDVHLSLLVVQKNLDHLFKPIA